MTFDLKALEVMLDPKFNAVEREAALSALADVADTMLGGGECPQCGALGGHDTNGHDGIGNAWVCRECGTMFDFEEV